ncbi:MAG: sugar transporter [Sphingomonadales bacterium]|nr:sugar transporter [Sphingomonadales bacterium]
MRRFWIVATFILLWSIAGVAAWYAQSHADLAALSRTDPVAARAFAAMPGWAWAAYFIATWSALAGAVALFARSRHATTCFALSLAGVVVQFGWSFLATDVLASKGPGAAVFPAVIALIALAELVWSRRLTAAGTLR